MNNNNYPNNTSKYWNSAQTKSAFNGEVVPLIPTYLKAKILKVLLTYTKHNIIYFNGDLPLSTPCAIHLTEANLICIIWALTYLVLCVSNFPAL